MCDQFVGLYDRVLPKKFDIFMARFYHSGDAFRTNKVRPVVVLRDSTPEMSKILCAPIVTPHDGATYTLDTFTDSYGDICIPIETVNTEAPIRLLKISDVQPVYIKSIFDYIGTIGDERVRLEIDKSLKKLFDLSISESSSSTSIKAEANTQQNTVDNEDDEDFITAYNMYVNEGLTAKDAGALLGIEPKDFYKRLYAYERRNNIKRTAKGRRKSQKQKESSSTKFPRGFDTSYLMYKNGEIRISSLADKYGMSVKDVKFLLMKKQEEEIIGK